MAPPSASTAEPPSQPAERKKQQLPQRKSIADLAEEAKFDAVLAKTKSAATNASNGSNGFSSESNGRENASAVPRTAPVLRIVDTHPEETASRAGVERKESSHEYSATV